MMNSWEPFIGLLAGSLMGAVPLAVGLLLGIYLARRAGFAGKGTVTAEQAERLIQRLFQWTNAVVGDMDECRQHMEALDRTAKAAQEQDAPATMYVDLMSQMVQANRQMQHKLSFAEDALAKQAERIATCLNEARTDPLTKLPNRRWFDEELARRHAEWKRYGTRLTLLLFDIDHFKRCNDTHGHLVGDEVICKVAQAIGKALRETDMLARYGGEEFAALLTSTNMEDSFGAVERARLAVAELSLDHEGASVSVTISCGAAEPLAGEKPRDLLQRADDALYASKNAGRNCGHWHDGTQCMPIGSLDERTSNPSVELADSASPEEELDLACAALRQRLLEVTDAQS